ncbi:hypothetical protein B4113_3486 [Geobacillus sp. B4113_201601]|nr:hypothetical protein B4113_3486 [Geobacillus sp. B4113_201601]
MCLSLYVRVPASIKANSDFSSTFFGARWTFFVYDGMP